MATIAEMLGKQWAGITDEWSLSPHAAKQATMKGYEHADVLQAAREPTIASDNRRYPGQRRHVRGGIVAVVDPARRQVVTVHENVTETAVRADQTDADARKYASRTGQATPRPAAPTGRPSPSMMPRRKPS